MTASNSHLGTGVEKSVTNLSVGGEVTIRDLVEFVVKLTSRTRDAFGFDSGPPSRRGSWPQSTGMNISPTIGPLQCAERSMAESAITPSINSWPRHLYEVSGS